MEPTTPNKNKTKIAVIIVIIFILVIGILLIVSHYKKINNSVNTNGAIITNTNVATDADSKELTNEINSATTFNNDADLNEIDKAFN